MMWVTCLTAAILGAAQPAPLGCPPDDAFEENDSCATAVVVGFGTTTGLVVTPADDDFYVITLPDGATLGVCVIFSHGDVDIDAQLIDSATCTTVLASSSSVTDNEELLYTNSSGADFDVLLRVSAFDPAGCGDYDLVITNSGTTGSACNPVSSLLISEVVSGALPGGLPKFVELANSGNMPINLADFSLGVFEDGGSTISGGASTVLSGTLAAANTHVVSFELGDAPSFGGFQSLYGFDPQDFSFGEIIDGNDTIVLFQSNGSGTNGAAQSLTDATVVDVYGVPGSSGTGTPWDYVESYAHRCVTEPNPNFTLSEWRIGAPNILPIGCGSITSCVEGNHLALTNPGRFIAPKCVKSAAIAKSAPTLFVLLAPGSTTLDVEVITNTEAACPQLSCASPATVLGGALTLTFIGSSTFTSVAATIPAAGSGFQHSTVTVTVNIPAGTLPGTYTVVGQAQVDFSADSCNVPQSLTVTGDIEVCIVDPEPGTLSTPRLQLEVLSDPLAGVLSGASSTHTFRISNNDPSEAVDLTLQCSSRQNARLPGDPGNPGTESFYAISSPLAGNDFPIDFVDNLPPFGVLPLPPDAATFIQQPISRLVQIAPLSALVVGVATRSFPSDAPGSCSEYVFRVDGSFALGDPVEACVGVSLYVDPFAENFDSFCFGDGGDQAGCTDCPCGNNAPSGSGGGCLNSVGTGAILHATGSAQVSADTLRFQMSSGTPNSFALLVAGTDRLPSSAANPCFGLDSGAQSPPFDGLRCVGVMISRQGARAIDSNGDVGTTSSGWGPPNGPPGGIAAGGGFAAGQQRHFQSFYREDLTRGCMRGINTSQGVTVNFLP